MKYRRPRQSEQEERKEKEEDKKLVTPNMFYGLFYPIVGPGWYRKQTNKKQKLKDIKYFCLLQRQKTDKMANPNI